MTALDQYLESISNQRVAVIGAGVSNVPLIRILRDAGIAVTVHDKKDAAALGAEMFSRESSRKRARSSKIVLAIIGVTAGVLCGLFGVGALLAAYVSRVTEDGSSFKANISAVLIVDNTFRIVLYSVLGLLTLDTVKAALLLMPFVL